MMPICKKKNKLEGVQQSEWTYLNVLSGISGSFECITDIQKKISLHHLHMTVFWKDINVNYNESRTHLVGNIQRIIIWR